MKLLLLFANSIRGDSREARSGPRPDVKGMQRICYPVHERFHREAIRRLRTILRLAVKSLKGAAAPAVNLKS